MNELIWMQIGTNSPRGKEMKRSTVRVKRSNVKVTQYVTKVSFGMISQGLSDKFYPNLAGTCYSKCPLCRKNQDAKGQKSRLREAKFRLGGVAETSLSWLPWVLEAWLRHHSLDSLESWRCGLWMRHHSLDSLESWRCGWDITLLTPLSLGGMAETSLSWLPWVLEAWLRHHSLDSLESSSCSVCYLPVCSWHR